ncbi:MAG: AAA family ATPase [Deltaproteobacteria bacterium]|nr:AAA family ATPase [Deltaproteobacteria bacterium]
MKILVVDRSAEGQTRIARVIENFDPADRDMLDLVVALASEQDYASKLDESDVLVFGPGVEGDLPELARSAKSTNPDIHMIAFISSGSYSSGTFRAAHNAKVRKVIPDSSSPLDLLQELVAIHEHYRTNGRMTEGRIVSIIQAKGGVGATTLAAALGKICSEHGRRTLLCDMDIESRDLSRALQASGPQEQMVSGWIKGSAPLTRETLRQAMIPLTDRLSLLPPPADLTAGMDFMGNPDHVALMQHLSDLMRVTHDCVLVDMAGRMGCGTGALLRSSDSIILLIDDSLLGLSGTASFLKTIYPLIKNKIETLKIICSSSVMRRREILSVINQTVAIPETCWIEEGYPADPAAETWPGTGNTLFESGQKSTKRSLVEIAVGAGLISRRVAVDIDARRSWLDLFSRSRREVVEAAAVNGAGR